MKLSTAGGLFSAFVLGVCAEPVSAQQRDFVEVDGWTISGQSDGRGPCRLEQSSTDGLFRYNSNGRITVAGGSIGDIDTRRTVPLILAINGLAETVRATASQIDGRYAYSFAPRRRPSFSQGFDLALMRGDEIVFQHQVSGAAEAYEEMLDCASDPFWPEPW
jgi:hypothetical protein